MCWEQFAETEANQGSLEPEEVSNLEADVEAACEWLDIDDDSPEASKDILEIVKSCLKGMKRLKTGRSIKMMTQLTAIAEYVKLHTQKIVPQCLDMCDMLTIRHFFKKTWRYMNAYLSSFMILSIAFHYINIWKNVAKVLMHARLPSQ